jgi:hypothetical protein
MRFGSLKNNSKIIQKSIDSVKQTLFYGVSGQIISQKQKQKQNMKIDEIKNLESQLETAIEHYESLGDHYGEIHAEYSGEIARYGDAWVGAGDQLNRLSSGIQAAKADVQAIKAKLPPVHGCSTRPFLWAEGNDESAPF